MDDDLGHRIRAWRVARGQSQAALAGDLNVTRAAVSYWESGERTPTQGNLRALVRGWGLTLSKFYGPMPKARRS